MNIATHLLICKKVYDDLSAYMEHDISLPYLLWGSIKPDIVKNNISHFKDDMLYLFYQKLETLKKMDYKNNSYKYSLELGEIFHYLCDYFTYAHNNKKFKKFFPHAKYENKLHKTAKIIINSLHFSPNIDYKYFSFVEIIEQKHKLYLSSVSSYQNDINFSYKIMLLVALKLNYLKDSVGFAKEEVPRLFNISW
ncbi:MAG: zinc dependent phospholipase C family protein [bacterium]